MYILGLDLGQAQDYTALVLIDKQADIKIESIKRFPKGTSYTDISDDINTIIKYRLNNQCSLVVDYTGVGRPVVDSLKQRGLYPIPVSITSGETMRFIHDTQSYNVPKIEIIAQLNINFETDKLTIPKDMMGNVDGQEINYTTLIIDELMNFQKKTNSNNHEVFSARTGKHDDIVLALGIAVWYSSITLPVTNDNWRDGMTKERLPWVR